MKNEAIARESRATLLDSINSLEDAIAVSEAALRGGPAEKNTDGQSPMPSSLILVARDRIDMLTERVRNIHALLKDLG